MTCERWERVKEVFASTLEIPADAREGFLTLACAGDHDLRVEVDRLLIEYANAGDFLQQAVAQPSQALTAGALLCERYRIVEMIGRGGMGEVYHAYDQLLDEPVAIKTLRADLAHREPILRRFQKEIQLARKVTHPGVCRIFERGVHQFPETERAPLHFFTMQLVEGETLAGRIRRAGALSRAEAFPLIVQMADGLRAAHEANIIHRDFKSGNVILQEGRAIITDFGLARSGLTSLDTGAAAPATETAGMQMVGTVAYMSPEQLSGDPITAASDIYSFGVVLFEMATGRLPFPEGPVIQSAVRRVTGKAPEVRAVAPDIDNRWERAIAGCLEPDPARRFRTMSEVVEVIEGKQRALRRTGFGQKLRNLRLRTRIVLGAVFVVTILAGFAAILRFPYRGVREGSRIIVTPTENKSGDARYDGLTTVLRSSLGQSSRFLLWESQRLGPVLGSMRKDPGTVPTAREWREIAFREKAPLIVFSTLSRLDDTYALTVHCEQIDATPEAPAHSWNYTVNADGAGKLFDAVRDASAWIRTHAGENESELSAHDRLPQNITSSSWEALELYAQAEQEGRRQKTGEAIALLRRAVELDPRFAMALMRLGDILGSQHNTEEGFQWWRKAIEQGRAQRLSEREALTIESRYAMEVGDYKEAEPVLRQWVARFPNDPAAREFLAACLLNLGRYPEALEAARESRARFGASLFGTAQAIHALAFSGRFAEIPAEISIVEKLPSPVWAMRFRGSLAAAQEDYGEAERIFRGLAEKAGGLEATRATSLLAALAAERGDLEQSATLLSEGIARDREAGNDGLAAQKASALAFVEDLRGNHARSRAWALEAVTRLESPQTVMQSASILARQGFLADAERLAKKIPEGTDPAHEVPALRVRGEILAAKHRYADAVETLERAAKIEEAVAPKEYLARALALDGQRERARILYAEITDTPWFIWLAPEYEWPGIRMLAKRDLQDSAGKQ